jgi:hypothetical protein
MNETTSTFQGSAGQLPPPSKYLWTADGRIRGIGRPAALDAEQKSDALIAGRKS